MQLDSIIYDKDTLATAIAEQWNLESTTFQAMYPSETATALVNGMAAYGSMLQYMLVAQLANCYIDTAFSDSAVYQLADTLGNNLHGNIPAKVQANITRKNLVYKHIIVPADCQFDIDNRKFFNPSAIIFPAGVEQVTDIELTQGEVMNITKFTSGAANEKMYFGSDFEVDNDSVKVWVNDELWNTAESFLDYDQFYVVDSSDLNTVVLKTAANGSTYIKFGDGTFANLPAAGSTVKIRYVINEGAQGNIESSNVEGTFLTPLTFVDNHDKDVNLELTPITTMPAYGGSATQSVDTLRQTSPAIFASGHRLVRRNDYKAFLQNKLGYLTSQVWGEYEEAITQGVDDAIMMNVVYYTGLKSYEHHPYYTIANIESTGVFEGLIASTRGFYGSFNIRISNGVDYTANTINYKDNTGKGIIFYRAPEEDKDVDDFIPSFDNDRVKLMVKYNGEEVDSNVNYDPANTITPDIKNIVSNNENTFVSTYVPTLARPLQIVILYKVEDIDKMPFGMSIAGVKFKPHPKKNFIGQFAMFATAIGRGAEIDLPSFDNIRNNLQWTRIIDKQELTTDSDTEYTDWVATNSFLLKQQYEKATKNKDKYLDSNAVDAKDFWGYYCFVIEIYSTDQKDLTDRLLYIDDMKLKYNFDYDYANIDEDPVTEYIDMSSRINYEENGTVRIKFPDGLINSEAYRLWQYTSELQGITAQNGYKNRDLLGFIYTSSNGTMSVPFKVSVNDVTNSAFLVEIGKPELMLKDNIVTNADIFSEVLTGTERILMQNAENLTRIYSVWAKSRDLRIRTNSADAKYKVESSDFTIEDDVELQIGDILYIDNTNVGTTLPLTVKVTAIDSNTQKPSELTLCNNYSFGVEVKDTMTLRKLIDGVETTVGTIDLQSTTGLDESTIWDDVSGATIKVSSIPNLDVDVSFTGNRIAKESIDAIDQVALNDYNHFTTLVEFKQPEVQQVDVYLTVCLETNSSISSAAIIQNVRNAVTKLFDITPLYMGKGLKISDIYKAVNSVEYVKFCNILKPTTNIEIKPNKFMVLGDLTIREVVESYK